MNGVLGGYKCMTSSDKDSGATRLKISVVISHKKWGGINKLVVNPNY